MKGNELTRAFAFVLLVAAVAPVALVAQTAPEPSARFSSEITAGYSYLFRDYRHSSQNPLGGGMNGWDAEYVQPRALGRHWGFFADGSGYYATGGFFTPQIYFTAAGPRYTMASGRSSFALRALAGAMFSSGDVIAQTASHVRPIVGAGGEWEYPAGQRLAWRFSFDWIYGGFNSNDTGEITDIVRNNGRLSAGPVWRF